jgi:hypothetical protein
MDEATFRSRLVEMLAFSGPWARRVANKGPEPGLAAKLGVCEDVVEDAAKLIRGGFVPQKGARLMPVDLFVPRPIGDHLMPMAERLMMSGAQLVRAILHAAMLTSKEPAPRAPRQWVVRPKGHVKTSARVHGIGFRGADMVTSYPSQRVHLDLQLSRGLVEALDRRAAAYGVTRPRYSLLWVADFVDGRLGPLNIIPVSTGQLYDDARAYVLPAVAPDASGRVP